MPCYQSNESYAPRTVNVPLPAYRSMTYAAAPHIGLETMNLMPNGGARLRIASGPQPHEQPAAKRSPARYTYPEIEQKTRRVLSSYRPGQVRPQVAATQAWLPTARRIRTVRPLGGRRFEVLR